MSHALLSAFTASKLTGLANGREHPLPAAVYGEQAFRHLLESESRRSERTGHCCQVLLIYRTDPEGIVMPIGPGIAGRAIAVLSKNMRDTDYIGWCREKHILGVVLTGARRESLADEDQRFGRRLERVLRTEFVEENGPPVHIRACRQGEVHEFQTSRVINGVPYS